MNKKIVLLFVLLFATKAFAQEHLRRAPYEFNVVSQSLKSAAASNSSMQLGYCSDVIYTSFGAGANATLKGGALFPESTMAKYAGNKITKLRIGTGQGSISNAQIFITYDKDATPFYTQAVTLTASSWNEITLATPYVIENKEIFIGYSVKSGTSNYYPVGVDAGPAVENGDWFSYSNSTGSSGWFNLGQNGYSYNISLKAVLEGDNLPKYDLTLSNLSIPAYSKPGKTFSLSYLVKNVASETITDFDLVYKIGSGADVTTHISGRNLASNQYDTIRVDNVSTSELGKIPVKAYLSEPNGANFSEGAKDTLVTDTIISISNYVNRKVLLEHFTTAKCTYCPAAHIRWQTVLASRSDVIWVAHHAGYLTDGFTIPQSESYLWFYNGSTYAPASILDRTNLYKLGADGSAATPVFYPGGTDVLAKLVDERLNTPAFITVNINKQFSTTDSLLDITVSGKAIQGFEPSNFKLNVFLTQDSLIASQTGGGSTYQHDHVIRATITPVWGDDLSLDKDSTYSKAYSYKFKSTWKPEKMRVVAFLSNYDNADVNDCMVYNAESANVVEASGGSTGIGEISGGENRIYVTGNNVLKIEGDFKTATLFDVTGKLLKEISGAQSSIPLSHKGVYIVKVVGDRRQTSKVVFAK